MQDRSNRGCDVSGRQAGSRNLIQERLEEMVIRTIDDRHVDLAIAEGARRSKAAETGAHDDDPRPSHGLV